MTISAIIFRFTAHPTQVGISDGLRGAQNFPPTERRRCRGQDESRRRAGLHLWRMLRKECRRLKRRLIS